MQVIYCNINIFDYDQQIFLVDGDKSTLIAKVPLNGMGRAMVDLCEKQDTYNVHLFCNVKGMADQAAESILNEEIKKYGKGKIEVQVN